jgi:hypothetical protein
MASMILSSFRPFITWGPRSDTLRRLCLHTWVTPVTELLPHKSPLCSKIQNLVFLFRVQYTTRYGVPVDVMPIIIAVHSDQKDRDFLPAKR